METAKKIAQNPIFASSFSEALVSIVRKSQNRVQQKKVFGNPDIFTGKKSRPCRIKMLTYLLADWIIAPLIKTFNV